MKKNETGINEELADEICKALMEDLYNLWEPIIAREYEWEAIESRVTKSIALTLSAVRDGQKIPGEVGRGEMSLVTIPTADYREVLSYWGVFLKKRGDPPHFIALRPEEPRHE